MIYLFVSYRFEETIIHTCISIFFFVIFLAYNTATLMIGKDVGMTTFNGSR